MAISQKFEKHFVNISTGCPYGLNRQAVFRQAMFIKVDDGSMGEFLAHGYRRNGNCMYGMRCPDCSACVPIRIRPDRFVPNRIQRRVWKKNREVRIGVAPFTMSDENLALLDKFLRVRFPDGTSSAENYYSGFFITSMTNCFEIRYRIDSHLVGVAIVDGSAAWLNAVYFYFDPDLSARSPGIFNILNLIDFCRNLKKSYLYLGYYIEEIGAMCYKSAFKPYELLLDGVWREYPLQKQSE
jgi:arginine-tRNA-protein transferase